MIEKLLNPEKGGIEPTLSLFEKERASCSLRKLWMVHGSSSFSQGIYPKGTTNEDGGHYQTTTIDALAWRSCWSEAHEGQFHLIRATNAWSSMVWKLWMMPKAWFCPFLRTYPSPPWGIRHTSPSGWVLQVEKHPSLHAFAR